MRLVPSRRGKWLIGSAATLVILYSMLYAAAWLMVGPRGFKLHWALTKVSAGMSRADVVAILGEPDRTGTTFALAQADGFEQEHARAAASNSKGWLFWDASDMVLAVGLDDHDRVTMTAEGGT